MVKEMKGKKNPKKQSKIGFFLKYLDILEKKHKRTTKQKEKKIHRTAESQIRSRNRSKK